MTRGAAIPATSAVPRSRYAVERRQLIVQTVRGPGRVDAAAMAEQLQVSTETIRKDLLQLERSGLLRRVHAGAVAIEDLFFEPAVTARRSNEEEKRRIARTALAELPREGAVFLGTNSISSERGLSTPDEPEAIIKRLMLSAARRRILLADHTKYNRTSLFKYGNLSDIDVLVIGEELPERDAYRLEAAGLKQVIRA